MKNYDSHLSFNELDKFDVKIKVIATGIEKYMTFFKNKNLVVYCCLLILVLIN